MKASTSLILILLLLLSGCTTFHGVTPLYPEVGNPNYPADVETTQPTFRWEAVDAPGTTYDLIVYNGIKVETFLEGVKRSRGEEIYYREGIETNAHKIEIHLEMGKEYYWSVRTRKGETVSTWGSYDYTLFLGTAYVKFWNRPYIFETHK
ncbi:MAG: hypothetical protein C0621_05345 [Desulfuromonas sp.]|nr:MAG: hypothetical protein C0621_05345 [Desulfuromonas sp.]